MNQFPRKYRAIRIPALGLAVFFLAMAFGCSKNTDKAPIGIVSYSKLVQQVTVPGFVNSNKKTILVAPYSGYISKIYVQVGQQVSAGDPIISITQSLHNQSSGAYPLRAPFSGKVMQILKTEGEYVEQSGSQASGNPSSNELVRIDDLSHYFVEASVPELEVDKLQEGQEVVIRTPALLGRTFSGKIKKVFLASKAQGEMDKTKVEFSTIIEVTNGDLHLKPGMSVVVDIITESRPHALTLRHEFIQRQHEHYFAILENGTKKEIKIGAQNEDQFEIIEGLSEGDRVQQTDFLSLLKAK
jgi:multidrug efflux pump subunit AcrA (membrane-fusion protein)